MQGDLLLCRPIPAGLSHDEYYGVSSLPTRMLFLALVLAGPPFFNILLGQLFPPFDSAIFCCGQARSLFPFRTYHSRMLSSLLSPFLFFLLFLCWTFLLLSSFQNCIVLSRFWSALESLVFIALFSFFIEFFRTFGCSTPYGDKSAFRLGDHSERWLFFFPSSRFELFSMHIGVPRMPSLPPLLSLAGPPVFSS